MISLPKIPRPNLTQIGALTCALVIIVPPAGAFACNIPSRVVGALYLSKSDLIRPQEKKSTAQQLGIDPHKWRPVMVYLDQYVKIKTRKNYYEVTFPKQRSISIHAQGPEQTNTNVYIQDPDSDAVCHIIGEREWQKPVIRVKETGREIHILAIATPNTHDHTGCITNYDWYYCPSMTRQIYTLKKPVGNRKVIYDTFDSPLAELSV